MSTRDSRGGSKGKVYLVGAGPGHPELLTLRALRVIESADVVLHDALVSPEVLALIPSGTRIENVGKRCGNGSMSQVEIHDRMIDHARRGQIVVRLQGGDPMLFGRAGEEITALARAGMEFEIVPGVTAASAAAMAAGVALTDRRASAQVVLLTGHRAGDVEAEIPAPAMGGTTVVVYMPVSAYKDLAQRFRATGWRGDTQCVVVSEASKHRQRIIRATLETIGDCNRLPAPSIVIVGDVVGLMDQATLTEDLPSELRARVPAVV